MIVELSLFNYLIFLLPIFWGSIIMKCHLFISGCTLLSSSLLFINTAILYFLHGISFSVYFHLVWIFLTVSFFGSRKWILLLYSLWQLCLLLGVFMFNAVIDMVGVLLPLSFYFFLLVVVPPFTLFCCIWIIWFKKYFSVPFSISVAFLAILLYIIIFLLAVWWQ